MRGPEESLLLRASGVTSSGRVPPKPRRWRLPFAHSRCDGDAKPLPSSHDGDEAGCKACSETGPCIFLIPAHLSTCCSTLPSRLLPRSPTPVTLQTCSICLCCRTKTSVFEYHTR